jgi:Cu+-exporting ATPase
MGDSVETPKPPTPTKRPSPISSKSRDDGKSLLTTTILINNLHCGSCVTYIQEILKHVPGIVSVEVSLVTQEVQAVHHRNIRASRICQSLSDAAFETEGATTVDARGKEVDHLEPYQELGLVPPHSGSTQHLKHAENCDACQKEALDPNHTSSPHSNSTEKPLKFLALSSPGPKKAHTEKEMGQILQQADSVERENSSSYIINVDGPTSQEPSGTLDEYSGVLILGGMTCASCVTTIEGDVGELDFVKRFDISLLQNTANVTFEGPKENISKVVEVIENLGYKAEVDVVSPTAQPAATPVEAGLSRFAARFSIEGMTCSSCITAITRGVEELPFVVDVVVELISNSARVEFEGKDHLNEITEKIDDLGYEATVVSCEPLNKSNQHVEQQPTERTILLKVNGMFCDHCPPKVLDALEQISSGTVVVDKPPTFKNPILTLTYTPDAPRFTVRHIVAAINSANEAFTSEVYHPLTIEERSRAIQQKERWHLMYRLVFTFIVAIPTLLIGVVFMSLVPSTNRVRRYLEEPLWVGTVTRMEWALWILATPVMFYGADVFHRRAAKELQALWRPGSKVPILRRFYRFGSMNLLISAGTSVAYVASLALLVVNATSKPVANENNPTYFDTVVFLTFFILIGRYLEAYSKAKTGDAVAMLGKLRPSEALLVPSLNSNESTSTHSSASDKIKGIKRVPVDLIEAGDHVSVPHGASPPADGIIDPSDSVYQFDESSLTGESKPVNKSTGDKVFAGSVNIGQPVQIKVSDVSGSSMLDQIVCAVREGQTKRAPVERVADIITGYFVPVITFLAIFTFVIWFALGQGGVLPRNYLDTDQGGWAFWSLEFAIAVFVVACPCGLGLAAPTALFVGGGLAAKLGILVRGGGDAFQEASHLDVIVFDKTGTLTEGGNLKVTDHEILPSDDDTQLVAWAATKAMEEASNHPIAKAITEFCSSRPSATIVSSSMEEIPGQGMKGTFEVVLSREKTDASRTVKYEAVIGNERLYHSLPLSNSPSGGNKYYLSTLLSTYQSAGKSTALLSLRPLSPSDSPLAQISPFIPTLIFATSDPLRPTTPSIIRALQTTYPDLSIHICTGDNPITATAVASALSIPAANVLASASPTQKAEYIHALQNPPSGPKKTVAFVGDGTNDTPALTRANVSIALSSGSDIAISSASFILLSSDLSPLLPLLSLSKKVFRRVKLNFMWAGVYNILLVPVAAGIFYPIGGHWRLGPVWASAAMAASSVSVVCSSLALRWF